VTIIDLYSDKKSSALAQVSGNYSSQFVWSKHLMVCFPSSLVPLLLLIFFIYFYFIISSLFLTGSCHVVFNVIYHSCQTNILCPFSIAIPMCNNLYILMYFSVSFLRIHM